MARLKLYLDQRSKMKDGTCHIKISISHRGTSALYPTDIFVKPNQWNPGNEDTVPQVRKTDTRYKQKNSLLETIYDRVSSELMNLHSENSLITFNNATQIKNHIQDKITGKGQISFTEYFVEYYTKALRH